MDADRLLDAIGEIGGDLILDAEAMPAKRRRRTLRIAAAVAAVTAALMLVFFQTPSGKAFAEYVSEVCGDLIERLFPPKTVTVPIEGINEQIDAEAHGELSVTDAPSPWADYVIYIDDRYKVTEGENYLRASFDYTAEPVTEDFYSSLPETYMEIVQVADTTPDRLAASITGDEAELGVLELDNITEPTGDFPFLCLTFSCPGEISFDDCVRSYYICENGRGGCFRIIIQTFLEAYEGHGARLRGALEGVEIIG